MVHGLASFLTWDMNRNGSIFWRVHALQIAASPVWVTLLFRVGGVKSIHDAIV